MVDNFIEQQSNEREGKLWSFASIRGSPVETENPNDAQDLATRLSYYIQGAGQKHLQKATSFVSCFLSL